MRGGYLAMPQGWERVSADGPGPFVTSEVLRGPDGTELRWRSRAHRKGDARRPRSHRGENERRGEGVWWRPRRRCWWMAVLFALGSLCFTLAALASQWGSSTRVPPSA